MDNSFSVQALDYIDYDTRDFTFNEDIPKAYRVSPYHNNCVACTFTDSLYFVCIYCQVMSVLMNYKRTVEDFKRCGSKAPTVYGLPYVSDCVSSNYDK